MFLICSALFSGCLSEEEAPVHKEGPTPVKVMEIKPRDLPIVVEVAGRLTANREVNLALQVSGVVVSYSADVGDRVQAGQVLLELDPKDYELAVAEARANVSAAGARLEMAEKSHRRFEKLLPRQVIARETFEKTETELKAARADLARARANLDYAAERLEKTRLIAPFSGLLAARMVEVGQSVGLGQFMGQAAMTVVDLDPIRVKVFLAEKDFVHLDRDDPVRVVVEAYPDRVFAGLVDRMGVKADPATNTFGVEILIDNPQLLLKDGLTARVKITTNLVKNAILIPQSTVLYRENRQEVFVIAGNRAEIREIELGRASGGLIRVVTGLKTGDRLAVSGGQYLKPGDQVAVQVAETL